MTKSVTARRWISSAVVTVLLALGLVITTVAIGYTTLERPDNIFSTGKIKLNLNDGNPVITYDPTVQQPDRANPGLFEPGMTVTRSFFLRNEGADCWYRLYFKNVSGGLADVLDITVAKADGTVLYSGKITGMTLDKVDWQPDELPAGATLNMTITFRFPSAAGNTAQASALQFDLCADGTQVKNNPTKEF